MATADELLEACQQSLTAEELAVVRSQRGVLMEKQLVSPDMIRMASVEQLVGFGLSPGGALALKKAFPTAAAGGAAAADIINATAARAAAEVAEQFTKLHAGGQQHLVDEVRSWNSSRTVEATKLSLSDLLVLRRLLRMYVVPEGAEVSAVLDPSDSDFEWDNTPEPGQRQSYLNTIQANLSNAVFSKLALKSQVRVDLKVKGLGCRIVAKSDELLIGRRWGNIPEAGCVIGIELKKKLTQASRRQGEAEFIAFSLASNFPFMQLVTDMQHCGFAYYKRRSEDMQQVVVEHALYGMGQFYEFLHSALSELPPVLTSTCADVLLVEELCNPDRVKLFEPAAMQAAASVLSDGPDCGDDALHELSDWYPSKQVLMATGELPPSLLISSKDGRKTHTHEMSRAVENQDGIENQDGADWHAPRRLGSQFAE